MRLYDGKKLVDIEMCLWQYRYSSKTPDWSQDFFNAGGLPYDEEIGACIVPDVDYCIECANDWKNCDGDFRDDIPEEDCERMVLYEIIQGEN